MYGAQDFFIHIKLRNSFILEYADYPILFQYFPILWLFYKLSQHIGTYNNYNAMEVVINLVPIANTPGG